MNKYIRNKKGEQSFVTVIALLILVTLIAFTTDLIQVMTKFDALPQATEYTMDIAKKQGGILSKLDEYPGRYVSRTEVSDHLSDIFNAVGVDYAEEVEISVNNQVIKSFGSASISRDTDRVDYGDSISVKITMRYRWVASGVMFNSSHEQIVNDGTKSLNCSRVSLSEYKYHYDNWTGGRP